tara:strand:- start:445 stop:579 length:135 start_codon:yes stop_codon:yes gene_type:complete
MTEIEIRVFIVKDTNGQYSVVSNWSIAEGAIGKGCFSMKSVEIR